jgi:hypothetical protein
MSPAFFSTTTATLKLCNKKVVWLGFYPHFEKKLSFWFLIFCVYLTLINDFIFELWQIVGRIAGIFFITKISF